MQQIQTKRRYIKFRDHEIHGFDEKVDWTDGHWRYYSLLDNSIATQFSLKAYVFSESVLCLGLRSIFVTL